MRARMSAGLTVLAAAVLVSACASTVTGSGQGEGAGPASVPASSTAPPSAPSSPASSPASSSVGSSAGSIPAASTAPAGVTPCPQPDPAQAAACLQNVLSQYWSSRLNQFLTERIVLDAVPAQVPPPCRPGIEAGTAITCRSDLTLYVSHPFLALIEHEFSGTDVALALASVASHEIGHVLQYTLHQPQIERRRPTDATSQFVEQQADCLSGVWASAAAAAHQLDADRFVSVAVALITAVSSNAEIATHGTPPQRRAAIERGLTGGSAGACALVTFH